MISLASSSLLPRWMAILGFGVVIVVICRPIVDVVPAQHLSTEVDEDLVHIPCEMSEGIRAYITSIDTYFSFSH